MHRPLFKRTAEGWFGAHTQWHCQAGPFRLHSSLVAAAPLPAPSPLGPLLSLIHGEHLSPCSANSLLLIAALWLLSPLLDSVDSCAARPFVLKVVLPL